MDHQAEKPSSYLYTYVCHEDEVPLCLLELRSLFGDDPDHNGFLESVRSIDVSRSPFIKQRLEIIIQGGSLDEVGREVESLQLNGETFKVVFVEACDSLDYDARRSIERQIGSHIRGQAEMRKPERLYGIAYTGERWVFGPCTKNEALWLRHNQKPQNYSTALSTRVARAVANIAVPHPVGLRVIDPCCGIGTVLIEALSMGVDIIGRDINPLAVRGARVNLTHFGLPDVVAIDDIRTTPGHYDAAIIDLPYNLCSVLSVEEQLEMLKSARRLADRAVIVATEIIDEAVEQAGFDIIDWCQVKKGSFVRHILVCV
ncbi:TRM11 family SAM-dependent methyltransferase [Paenibacillus sp. UNC451MF]|uniref:TRM11 family SAM-dependent methyltransferase n=1 Tax=Paenibacillus sp. UNC451MF TaxID=1449063 RepID=UPI00048E8D16|nr:RsmD family RNA methyltransferase [Paenibacillus sp. UNC451MF]